MTSAKPNPSVGPVSTAPLVLHYRRQYYQETLQRSADLLAAGPKGLVGREVANHQWLAALLKHSAIPAVDVLLQEPADQAAIEPTIRQSDLAGKRIRLGPIHRATDWFAAGPNGSAGCVLWQPQPPSASWAWKRARTSSDKFALCGVTHALCSPTAIAALRDLVTAPIQPYDRLVCTSDAVAQTARTILQHWTDVIGVDREPIRLETIPLGVDVEHHRPATPDQRAAIRTTLQIAEDDRVVLFVGRLSHHAKSNPLVLLAACQSVAAQSKHPITLIFAGWFASDAIEKAFRVEAKRVAPNVRVLFVDGTDSRFRDTIWHAADVFVSLADSIQETFGLTVVEASARGLPVVATDWNGYRETIVDDETGFLIPTAMVRGVASPAWTEMLENAGPYDHFLARVGQGVVVDLSSAVNALSKLLADDQLRLRMGQAGREHVTKHYAWPVIMARYDALWAEQRLQLSRTRQTQSTPTMVARKPVGRSLQSIAPEFDTAFAKYPTCWIDGHTTLAMGQCRMGTLDAIAGSPLASHAGGFRLDLNATRRLLQAVASERVEPSWMTLRAGFKSSDETIAWAIKYDLLTAKSSGTAAVVADTMQAPSITLATTCMGRLDHLRQTLPVWCELPGVRVVVVDYACPDRCGDWVRANFSEDRVAVVRIDDRMRFDRSEAKNAGIVAATTPWVCLIDADIIPAPDFITHLTPMLRGGRFLRSSSILEGTGGTFLARRDDLIAAGMHDPAYQGWGEEDDDLLDALQFAGLTLDVYPDRLIRHLDHNDDMRTRFHDHADRRRSHMINRVYRAAKWDIARMTMVVPSLASRRRLYAEITRQLTAAIDRGHSVDIVLETGKMNWVPLASKCSRQLIYHVDMDDQIAPGTYAKKTP